MQLNNPGASVNFTSGAYTGDGTAARAIPHGLGHIPHVVLISGISTPTVKMFWVFGAYPTHMLNNSTTYYDLGTAMDATNVYVYGQGGITNGANENTKTYEWIAF